jgi:hypothetical protein
VTVDELPADELPNGLPLFNVFLHVPAYGAELQLFRLVRSYAVDRFTLHSLLVHPQQVDALPALAGALGFCQLHGELWTLDNRPAPDAGAPGAVTLGRAGQPARYTIAPGGGGERVQLRDAAGDLLAEEERTRFLADDLAKVRFLRECFQREYADDALSVPLVRAYPGRTSLIRQGRPFPRLLATDPVGPGTDVREVWWPD